MRKRYVFILGFIFIALSGCGTFTDADYAVMSRSQANGLWNIFTGSSVVCKFTHKGETAPVDKLTSEEFARLCEDLGR